MNFTIPYLLFFALISSFSLKSESKYNRKEFQEDVNELNELLEQIPAKNADDMYILQKKFKMLKFLEEKKNGPKNSKIEKTDNNLTFNLILPEPLSEEEKKIDVRERIARKYIGDIPNKVDDLIYFITKHENCIKQNTPINNRLLLSGKPGCGKTYLVAVLAQELQVPAVFFVASDFGDKYIGVASQRIRHAFEAASKLNKPVIIFIDEIDAIATKRKESMNQEHRAILITVMTELEKIKNNKNLFFIGATNDPSSLDSAIIDRFSSSICYIQELTCAGRIELFKKLYSDYGRNIDSVLAKRLAELTGPSEGRTEYHDGDPSKPYYYYGMTRCQRFGNREIETLVKDSLVRQAKECDNDPNNCKKNLCIYIRQALNEFNKITPLHSYLNYFYEIYSDGI